MLLIERDHSQRIEGLLCEFVNLTKVLRLGLAGSQRQISGYDEKAFRYQSHGPALHTLGIPAAHVSNLPLI